MAAEQLDLVLRSVPSTWKHPDLPPTPEPYERIVAMACDLGDLACKYEVPGEAASRRLVVPRSFAWRLMTFFEDHIISGPNPETASLRTYSPSRYNCHGFAISMLGEEWWDMGHALNQVRIRARSYTPTEENLALGAHGVYRFADGPHAGAITHSVIGLGEDVPLCIQAMNDNSNLAVMPYTLMRASFQPHPGAYELAA
jgi:hypothetical protein